jgi:hypothetical protein
MKKLELTQDEVALIDDSDYEALSKFKWTLLKRKKLKHAYRTNKGQTVHLHRFIMGLEKGDKRQVDHINGNGLDNRRENLRVCTIRENQFNRGRNKNNTSGYKGVIWNKQAHKWQARIHIPKQKHLGYFNEAKDAANAYKEAAKLYQGNFAYGG